MDDIIMGLAFASGTGPMQAYKAIEAINYLQGKRDGTCKR